MKKKLISHSHRQKRQMRFYWTSLDVNEKEEKQEIKKRNFFYFASNLSNLSQRQFDLNNRYRNIFPPQRAKKNRKLPN